MMAEASCECGARLDICGRHRGACARSGRLRAKAVGPERSLARVCREAGATVRTKTLLRDMNLCVPAFDARAIGVLATRFPLHHDAQLAVDITLRGVWGACGGARPNASHTDGVLLIVGATKNGSITNFSSARGAGKRWSPWRLVEDGATRPLSSSAVWLKPKLFFSYEGISTVSICRKRTDATHTRPS